ncbi:MAG: DUF2779 domain-containing protein [Candidatus Buchananbacteria bacterium]|nr:DUF2779 domain-containing protein [Candidatus Buchananbacteria bacterium]
MISKSQFLKYIQCYKYLWLYKFRRELLPEEVDASLQRIFDEGYEIEDYAKKLFPKGVEVEGLYDKAEKHTKKLIKEGNKLLFQATAMANKLYCMADIFSYNPKTKKWDIYEVKSSTKLKDIHIIDLAFQKTCFEGAGYEIGKLHLVHVNNQYVRKGKIDPKKLLKIEDLTSEVKNVISGVHLDIENALELITKKDEPQVKILKQCKNPFGCNFIGYCWKDIPEHSIYNIAGSLTEKKLNELLDQGIIMIKDIPDDYLTKHKSILHHNVIKQNKIHIEKENIKSELSKLKYPLYFLDYETFSPAIPMFDGYKPYQRIVFQFSLHVQESKGAKLKHYEFLAKDKKDPTNDLLKALKSFVKGIGTFIAWNDVFEKGCNREMARRAPKYSDFLQEINNSMYDLMMIFRNGYYVHKNFHGSASIKKVLPVIVPKLSYKDLEIQEGGTASQSWLTLIDESVKKSERNKLATDMLKYCELDTFAMVEILRKLKEI